MFKVVYNTESTWFDVFTSSGILVAQFKYEPDANQYVFDHEHRGY